MLEAEVFDVHLEFAQLSEETAELTGRVVDHDDDVLESTVLAVLSRQPLDALVAAAGVLLAGESADSVVGGRPTPVR